MIRNHSRHGSRFPITLGGGGATDPYWPFVSMLLHGDGTNAAQNNTFLDGSTNNFTVTRNGNTTQGSFNPFVSTYPYSVATNGGSAYFDGTGDYLTVPNDTAFTLGATSTTEAWVYLTSATGNKRIVTNGSNTDSFDVGILGTTNTVFVAGAAANTSTAISLNTWTHVAVVFNSGTLTIYFNGVSQALVGVTTGYSLVASTLSAVFIGAQNTSSYFPGYISNLRVVKGTAVYTANFTPPTAPLTAITNTSLLLGFTNGAIYDNAEINNLETVSSAQISTSVFKYGTGSVRTGSGNYLSTPMKSQFQFAAGDFTVETWAYIVNNVATASLLDCNQAGSNFGWFLEYSNTRGLLFYMGTGSSGSDVRYATTPALTTWTHLAVSRQSGTLRLFINGVLVASGSLPNSSVATLPLLVGAANSYTTLYYFDGYLDDIRITNGVARYTATFTPPTAAFPNS